MKNPFHWLLTSNRLDHLYMGTVIFFFFTGLYAIMLAVFGVQLNPVAEGKMLIIVSVLAFLCALFYMITVEFIQHKFNVKPDILDVCAGCLVPLILLVCIVLLVVFDAV